MRFNQINEVLAVLIHRESVWAAISELGYASHTTRKDINSTQRQNIELERGEKFLGIVDQNGVGLWLTWSFLGRRFRIGVFEEAVSYLEPAEKRNVLK